MQEAVSKMRKNGFELPFHPLQVVSWVVFGTDVFVFLIFALPLIETRAARILVGLVFVASVACLVYMAYKATSCDASDKHILQQESDLPGKDTDANLAFCTMCNSSVHQRSKHCRSCNKCIHVFDHHCMWLNNCVGEYNYRFFAGSIGSVAVMTGTCLACCIYLVVDLYVNCESFEERMHDSHTFGPGAPHEVAAGLLIALIIVNFPLFTLDMQLVFLHVFLTSQQLTTYEYIMHKHHMQMEALEKSDKYKADKKTSNFRRSIKTLPRCMDWIVFRPSKRKSKKNKIERLDQGAPASDPEPFSDVEKSADAANTELPKDFERKDGPSAPPSAFHEETTSQTSSSKRRAAEDPAQKTTPSPPGSTTDGRDGQDVDDGSGAVDDGLPTTPKVAGDKALVCSGGAGMILSPKGPPPGSARGGMIEERHGEAGLSAKMGCGGTSPSTAPDGEASKV